MATAVYLLSFLASAACGWLLVRSYLRTGTKLLLWTAACFVLLAFNNFLVVWDLVFFPRIDLQLARLIVSLLAAGVLLYGFIWERD